ncbi:hypothetical protein SAMN05444851_2138 [Aliiroseovarius sediminilitoris]|uniref:PH domain-containing protein n=1 Tax=Aliiroseovarius sediminilitoris TaxID=1173584 RepID=A0A1I0Q2S2_9RHOB|nr:hypothetical protein [Aliiroseovarius sediminilitoris]SEW20844.1 hypothetical protein SAMN05444851_2138 [Aliiroseovarius sediminilitoris]
MMQGNIQNTKHSEAIPQDRGGPALVQTPWGYRLSAVGAEAGLLRITHAVGRFVGLVLLLIIAGVWSFSANAFADPLIMAMKLGLTGLLFVVGWMLFWYGRDARQVEAQVDLDGCELRIGHRDGLNRFRQETRIPFSDIGSFLILRTNDDPCNAALYARIGSGMDAYEVIEGTEAALEPIQARLVTDLTGERRRRDPKNRRISRVTGNAISLARVSAP